MEKDKMENQSIIIDNAHEFDESLEKSQAAEDLPFWEKCYRKIFTGFQSMKSNRDDMDLQMLGVDRSIVVKVADREKIILVDEKSRYKIYNDISLEYISNDIYSTPGWICKPLFCEYIAYAFLPANKCYLMPVVQLQKAFEDNRCKWGTLALQKKDGYSIVRAKNTNKARTKIWYSKNLAIPINDLMNAIKDAFIIDLNE